MAASDRHARFRRAISQDFRVLTIARLQDKYKGWDADRFTTWSQPDFERYYPFRFAEQVREALAKSHGEKRAAKKALLDDVKAWSSANPRDAKSAFEESAAEVIEKLRSIDRALRG